MDAHGIRGDLYCLVFSGDVSWIEKISSLVIKSEEFKIKKIKAFKKGFIVTLEGFVDRNKAEEYKGAEVKVDADIFIAEKGEQPYLIEILSFEVIDKQLGSIGNIESFSSNGAQDLLVINYKNKKVEIPFVEELVLKVDYKNKLIKTDLPEGLLEINEKD